MGRSPLALYLLALFREEWPSLGPWAAEDDPDDLFRVTLTCPTRTASVRAVQKRSGNIARVEATPDGPWIDQLRKVVTTALWDAYSLDEHQRTWHLRRGGSSSTPDPTNER